MGDTGGRRKVHGARQKPPRVKIKRDQVFRLKAEAYKTSRKARITPFKTFSVSTTLGSIRDESSLGKKPKRFDKFS
jgi:hypothetical protein